MNKIINFISRTLNGSMLCISLLTGCTKINEVLEDHEKRIDNLDEVYIASISKQISSINASLTDLHSVDESLQELIDDLEAEAADLQTQLDDNIAADAAAKKVLEDEIANIKTLITALQTKDAELDKKIAALKDYVDGELKNAEEWADATFATLAQYESVQTELSAIKALIEQNESDVSLSVVEKAISTSEASMKSWVNETLANGYYDIAAIDGKISVLQSAISAGDATLQNELDELSSSLEQAKSDLADAYKAAISEAINANNGIIRGEIVSSIVGVQDALGTRITTLESGLATIESRLFGIEQKIDKILEMIQSVVYMPEYSDGVTYVDAADKQAEISFKISPSAAVAALEDIWSQALTIKYITTALTKSAPLMKDLSITSSEFDDNLGTVSLVVDCANLDDTFFEGSSRASAALFISDGTTSVSSEFISLLPSFGIDEDLSYTSDITSLSLTPDVTSVTFTGTVLHPTIGSEVGIFYSTDPYFTVNSASKISTFEFDSQKGFSIVVPSEWINMQYYYCLFTVSDGAYKYGKIKTFSTKAVSASSASVEVTYEDDNVVFDFISGIPEKDSGLEYGIIYSRETTPTVDNSTKLVGDFDNSRLIATDLYSQVTYYYRIYYSYNSEYVYGDIAPFVLPLITNLSSSGTANCYIVSASGGYKFRTVKGNSSEPVGSVESASVLWESFGTSVTPSVGSLIKSASYKDGYITFQTPDTFKEGNAVIAAKQANGKILWSWHIWLTDQPQGQVYDNDAGTMMDRNLGATSATPGDVGALGLLYQWGRKDPFLNSSTIYSKSSAQERTPAKSTITWPSVVSSDSKIGTVDYATVYPTTFIKGNVSSNWDWLYTGDTSRWSSVAKTIYDPCPAGWRVPNSDVWSKAIGSSSSYIGEDGMFDDHNRGVNFSEIVDYVLNFGSDSVIWYPAAGSQFRGGTFLPVGHYGSCWSAFAALDEAYCLWFTSVVAGTEVQPKHLMPCEHGLSVRCIQESK